MKSSKSTSVRQLSNGSYRVSASSASISHSAVTGRFVTSAASVQRPHPASSERDREDD